MSRDFSTWELSITKLLKYFLYFGSVGIIIGIALILIIENHLGMLKPEATNILLAAIANIHMAYPLLFPLYMGFAIVFYLLIRYNRHHERSERYKRWLATQEQILKEGGDS